MIADFKAVVKSKNFSYLWTSQILSQLTIHLMNFLLLVKLFEETGSTIATAFLWVAFALPAIIVGPIAAASVDMVDRRRLLMITNLLQSMTILFYAVFFRSSLFLLYGVALMYSLFNQFYVPGELAVLPSLINKKRLPYANGLFLITQQASVILGFAFAGILSNLFGFATTIYLGALMLFLAFLSVSRLPKMQTGEKLSNDFEKAFMQFFERIYEGYTYIKSNNFILVPLALLLVLHTAAIVMMVNAPVIVEQIFQINVSLVGFVLAIPVGLGALTGALMIPTVLKRGLRKIRIIESSFTIAIIALFVFTFIVPQIEGFKSIYLGVFTVFLLGFGSAGVAIPTQTFLQEVTPSSLRGRVFGNYWFLATIVSLFPVIFSGTIAELFGVRALLLLVFLLSIGILVFIKRYADKFIEGGFSFSQVHV
ncbi:MFS transporter [Patescibacteria group bacterium]|nr:MFS transporter [Patescibacteria group bacterium]